MLDINAFVYINVFSELECSQQSCVDFIFIFREGQESYMALYMTVYDWLQQQVIS